ncbi:MAG: uroporphyrinogen-III C-methyltransferase [Candidatus Weimeria sp.]|nr:uroporphyrinogen-III C-methyltransferase [Candidatus Weimeria sp.]
MTLFPFFIDIDHKTFLIVGGGAVAEEKFRRLSGFTKNLVLIARDFSFNAGESRCICKDYESSDLEGISYCIAATSDRKLNRQIAKDCEERGILVNVVDDPRLCTFIFPSLVKQKDLVAAITTTGKSPAMAQWTRKVIEEALPEYAVDVLEEMADIRSMIRGTIPVQKARKICNQMVLSLLLERHSRGRKLSGGQVSQILFAFVPKTIRLATRSSALALVQSNMVKAALEELGMTVELVPVKTAGDLDQRSALTTMGGRGVFVKEIEHTLLAGEADIAVHSGKDLPMRLSEGLVIAATPKAADPRDVLLTRSGEMEKVVAGATGGEEGSVILATGSLRRQSELKRLWPAAGFMGIRGNVDTRLRKLSEGVCDGLILAKAGLDRLGVDLSDYDMRILDEEECIPSACQGIVAVECKSESEALRILLSAISDEESFKRFTVERQMLAALEADCSASAGAQARICGEQLSLHAMFGGRHKKIRGPYASYRSLCSKVAEELKKTEVLDEKKGRVALVGAGPSLSLLTLRGRELLSQADAVVFDDLLDPNVILEAPEDAKLIYVGKRLGEHYRSQEEINGILISLAEEGMQVVRLKGGDPYVFGRGGEEVTALMQAKIPYELVPGVTSAVAVPEHLGIPVTHRKMARSFTVVTGHTAAQKEPGELVDDTGFRSLGSLGGTLVFLMGISHLKEITAELMAGGKDPMTPAAVCSCGYSSREIRINGTLSDIAERARDAATPGILVVGQVASLSFAEEDRGALANTSVTVTGTDTFTRKLFHKLTAQGAYVRRIPHLKIRPVYENIPERFMSGDWLTFTSANGVAIFFEGLKKRKTDLRSLSFCRFACIGEGTAQALQAHGFTCDLMPKEYTARALGEALARNVTEQERVILLRARIASVELPRVLREAGISYEDYTIYESDCRSSLVEGFRGDTDYIVFSSASGVREFYEKGGDIGDAAPVCIGNITAAALKGILEEKKESKKIDIPSVATADAVVSLIKERQK